MSLGIVVKSPSGIVLAADSRVTMIATNTTTNQTLPVHFDNATKVLRFGSPNHWAGAVTFGQALIPKVDRTPESFLPELESGLPAGRQPIGDFAQHVSDFYMGQWQAAMPYQGPPMIFYIAGFDEGAPYGRVFKFSLPSAPAPVEEQAGSFGMSWGGQMEIVDRIVRGHEAGLPDRLVQALALSNDQRAVLQGVLNSGNLPIPIQLMALQDCVDLALTLIRTTIAIQQLSVTLRGVGGPVDVVTITRREGLKIVQFKEVTVDPRR